MKLNKLDPPQVSRPPHLQMHPVALHKKALFAIQDVDGDFVQGVAMQSILHRVTSWSAASEVGTRSLLLTAAEYCCAEHPAPWIETFTPGASAAGGHRHHQADFFLKLSAGRRTSAASRQIGWRMLRPAQVSKPMAMLSDAGCSNPSCRSCCRRSFHTAEVQP